MPPEPPIFFVDRNLGRAFPEHLRENNINIIIHDDHFPQTTNDEEWLAECGQNNWFVISLDKRIRYNPTEKAALEHYEVGLFVMVGKNIPIPGLAEIFVATYPKILRFIENNSRPFVAKIYRDRTIRKVPL